MFNAKCDCPSTNIFIPDNTYGYLLDLVEMGYFLALEYGTRAVTVVRYCDMWISTQSLITEIWNLRTIFCDLFAACFDDMASFDG